LDDLNFTQSFGVARSCYNGLFFFFNFFPNFKIFAKEFL
jgi:hypothetical protein